MTPRNHRTYERLVRVAVWVADRHGFCTIRTTTDQHEPARITMTAKGCATPISTNRHQPIRDETSADMGGSGDSAAG